LVQCTVAENVVSFLQTETELIDDPRRIQMNKDVFEGKWKMIRDQSKVWWGLLTESDLNRVDQAKIKFYEYVTILQLKYELDRQVAKDEIDRHVMEYETSMKPIRVTTP
jgi:hypothetical protein